MTPDTAITIVSALLMLVTGLALGFSVWMSRLKRAEAAQASPSKPLTDGQTLFYILLIISACAGAFWYFRATFPH